MKLVLLCVAAICLALPVAATQGQSAPPPPPPPVDDASSPTPTDSPTPTGSATATPVPPTPTPSPVPSLTPLRLKVVLGRSDVMAVPDRVSWAPWSPASPETVSVQTVPHASVRMLVSYQGGTITKTGTASASGQFAWSFMQPRCCPPGGSRTGKVAARISSGGRARTITKGYFIQFNPLAWISYVYPQRQKPGGSVAIWVHSFTTPVEAAIRYSGAAQPVRQPRVGYPGAKGWARIKVLIPGNTRPGRAQVVLRPHASGCALPPGGSGTWIDVVGALQDTAEQAPEEPLPRIRSSARC